MEENEARTALSWAWWCVKPLVIELAVSSNLESENMSVQVDGVRF